LRISVDFQCRLIEAASVNLWRRDPLLASVAGLNLMSCLTIATACRAQQLNRYSRPVLLATSGWANFFPYVFGLGFQCSSDTAHQGGNRPRPVRQSFCWLEAFQRFGC
jgi:hypothetical protein